MRRTAEALLLVMPLSFLAVMCFVGLAVANPTSFNLRETMDTSVPSIRIQAPEPSKVYNVKSVSYSIIIEKPPSWIENGTGYLNAVGCIIDGKENITIADANSPSVSISVEEPHKLVFTPNPDFIDLH